MATGRPPRGARVARTSAAGLAVALTLAGAHHAAAEPMPRGRISLHGGGLAGTGAFAAPLGRGYAYGAEAAWQPLRNDQSIGLGLSWSITWSRYLSDSARISGELLMLQMGLGARARVPLGARREQVLFLGGGVALSRMNEPPLVGGERAYVGPWAAAGIESMVLGAQIGLEARYVVSSSDNGTIGLLLSVGWGS